MKKRTHNIFARDGKTMILAFDHGTVMDIRSAAPDPGTILRDALDAGVDTVLTTAGIASAYSDVIGNTSLLIRVDAGRTIKHPVEGVFRDTYQTFSVAECARLGADGIICMLFPNLDDQKSQLERIGRYFEECNKYGLGFCIEVLPGGFTNPELETVDNIGYACRLACDFGADFVKAPYVQDDKQSYLENVIQPCYKPLIVLGGGGKQTDRQLLQSTRDSLDAGCSGIAYGRVIWGHKNVKGICSALLKVIHEDASVDDALRLLEN